MLEHFDGSLNDGARIDIVNLSQKLNILSLILSMQIWSEYQRDLVATVFATPGIYMALHTEDKQKYSFYRNCFTKHCFSIVSYLKQGAAPLGADTPELWLVEKNNNKKRKSENNFSLTLLY